MKRSPPTAVRPTRCHHTRVADEPERASKWQPAMGTAEGTARQRGKHEGERTKRMQDGMEDAEHSSTSAPEPVS